MLQPIEIRELRDIELVPQATIKRPISYFDGRFGIRVVSDHDDLDAYQGAALSLNGELPFALRHYRGYPPDTTTIYLSREFSDVNEITGIVAKILRELELPASAISWQRADNPDL
jgi:hypothetical protein